MRRRIRALGVVATLTLGSMIAHAQWLNYPTPGIPRLADGKPNLGAPTPMSSDGRPDLSGIWATECGIAGRDACFTQSLFFDLAKGLKPEDVQPTAWAAFIQAQRAGRNHVDDPYGYCLPPGTPRIDFGGGPFKIIQTSGVTALLYEAQSGMTFRQVFTDGRTMPASPEPTWLGYSIGRWDGDTFVVDTTGFKDNGWLDTLKARPHSDALRVTERFRRVDLGHIDLQVTIDDPKAYAKPWTIRAPLTLQADTELMEFFCNNHDKSMEHRRISDASEPPSPR